VRADLPEWWGSRHRERMGNTPQHQHTLSGHQWRLAVIDAQQRRLHDRARTLRFPDLHSYLVALLERRQPGTARYVSRPVFVVGTVLALVGRNWPIAVGCGLFAVLMSFAGLQYRRVSRRLVRDNPELHGPAPLRRKFAAWRDDAACSLPRTHGRRPSSQESTGVGWPPC
jgi:hypothetical protein